MIAPDFLDLEEVLEIHALQLDEFGGIAGVRDRGVAFGPMPAPSSNPGACRIVGCGTRPVM